MPTKPKAVWTPAFHKIFLDLCIEQTLAGNKPETHFSRDGWKNIVQSFNDKTGSSYDRMQMKNHWDMICKQWKIWCKLTGCGYMKWDPGTNTFGASDEDWANYLKANPNAAPYRLSPPRDIKKLEMIFAGNSIDAGDDGVQAQLKRLSRHQNDESDCGCEEDEQSMFSSLGTKRKGYWTPTSHELFIDLCVQETLGGNKPGTHFTMEGWKNILETFNKKTGLGYTRLQLKNHWDSSKKQWKIWCKLIRTNSMRWDPDTRTFGATGQEWESYIHANRSAGQFRHKQIPFADKLEIIFNGRTNMRETDPPSRRRRLNDHSTVSCLQIDDEPMLISPLNVYDPDRQSPDREATRLSLCRRESEYSTPSRLHAEEPDIASPGGEASHRCDAVESRSNVTVQKSPDNVQFSEGKSSYSIGECIECLDGMEEVEQGSDLYLFALDIFLKKEYREIFLQLKKPGLRIAWLQRLQSFGSSLS